MITADPSTLRYGAQRFAAAAQEMQRNADRLLETTTSVRQGQEGWSGEGAQSFQLRGERLAADVKQASSAFTSIANTMSRFAMRMERVLELRLRADQLDQRAFEYGDDTLDSIHTRQHLRHQAAQLRHQADSEASLADSQASAEFQMIARMIPATLIPGADASTALLDGLPKHWQDYYRRHPELLKEEKIAPTLTMGSYKRADEVGVQEFLDEQQQDDQSILDKMQGFIAGGVDGEKELLFGLITAVSHPIDTVQDIAYAVTHPDLVVASLVRKKDEFVSDWKRGNTYGWSKTFHEIIWSVIGLKGAGVTEEGAELASTAVKSKIELFGNILTPSQKVIFSDGTVIRVSDRVIQSNEELLSYFKREQTRANSSNAPWETGNTYTPVDYKGTTKVDGEVKDISRRVYQRGDIDWNRVDPNSGLTNLELMKKGRPPYWKDGTKVELHHTIQVEPGPMVELPASLHDEYSKILHGLVENGGSFRNNPALEKQYNNFRSKYWRWRANQLED